ncbi:UDP-N-acetylmuramate--L-alanine ligase [Aestuariivivens sediminicola]|uniref:UDP-N-acetylmuramate--L-alanine ligase n=1 Tax=Aestuariivivens sediminicola TaxID=2913560 RepID=UPI001F5937C2|nr:UDP-N-acetylmuramate--L-alanine ligase [Aestuariivivens sediminicola]
MVLKEIHNVYLIGIGGIGMSALARYFLTNNKHVAGYDKTPSEITYGLSQLGASIHFEDDVKKIDKIFLDKKRTLVIYTPAVPKDLRELTFFKELGFKVYKRSEILGLITEKSYCFAVAGTHGKTTTTSILAHLLYECNIPFTAFLGGISENYDTNFILRGSEVTVVEADEFDRSFLSLKPDMACITSMDADHLDVYGEAEVLRDSFKAFALCLKPNGKLFVRNGLPLKGITYGIEDDSDYSIININIENGTYVFDVKTSKTVLESIRFNLPGRHNLSNALIALAMAVEYGCPPRQLVKALASFKGVKRRFTYHINTEDFILIDDYAHHPEEINAVYQAVREMYPKKKVLAIFQPHLYSRTRDFANDFARSLAQFDALLLLDIYPAREVPINGITSAWLLDKIGLANKQLVDKNELIDKIHESSAQIVITMGAGDISDEVKLIKKEFSIAS